MKTIRSQSPCRPRNSPAIDCLQHATVAALGMCLVVGIASICSGQSLTPPANNTTIDDATASSETDWLEQTIAWRREHETQFRRPYGWLALIGHFWLKPGDNRLGSRDGCDIRLPSPIESSESIDGTISVQGTTVRWTGRSSHRFTVDGENRRQYTFQIDPLSPEADAKGILVIEDRYQVQLVRRAGKLAVRVRDPQSERRILFPGKVWYPPRQEYRFTAKYTEFEEPITRENSNVRGMSVESTIVGQVEWLMAGQSKKMLAMEEGDELFFVFRDATCGNGSYDACRFLNIPKPILDGKHQADITLDFNRTYNPPCAFSEHTLCPLPPAENRFEFALPAGEAYRPRSKRLDAMEKVMGPLPASDSAPALDVRVVSEEQMESFTRRKITYVADEGDRVPAWLLIPNTPTSDSPGPHEKRPAMLCLHQTIAIGKDEPVGLGNQPSKQQALDLVKRGYVCLAPDYPSFGEYPYDFAQAFESGRYQSGTAKAIWNNKRAIDLLCAMPEVDGTRIGAIGHSLGGHNALFTAAFDDRIRVVVTSCGFCSFHRYYGGNLKGWTSERYMPKIASQFGSDPQKMPFDFDDVLMSIYPRNIFVMAPKNDANFDFTGVRNVIDAVAPSYANSGISDRFQAVHPDAGHEWPERERELAYSFIDTCLKANE